MSILPTHLSGKGPVSYSSRKARQRILLLAVFMCFLLFCFGALSFLPESSEKEQVKATKTPNSPDAVGEVLAKPNFVQAQADANQENAVTAKEKATSLSRSTPKSETVDMDSLNQNSPEYRKLFIKKMAQHAWKGYEEFAWGENELKPLSERGHSASVFGTTHMGATIVDSLDTLYLMGMMDEFDRAKKWVLANLNFDQDAYVSTFEMTIRFVGGLLSTYALTKDEGLKEKALEIADRLLPAFESRSGIPYSLVHLRNGQRKNWNWAPQKASILAEAGTVQLEMAYLTELTGKSVYHDKAHAARSALFKPARPDGLYYNYISPENGNWGKRHVSLGALGDSFYEYLLKAWIQTSKQDEEARLKFDEVVEAIGKQLVGKNENDPDHLVYVREMMNGRPVAKMDHLACFAGGMFALGSLGAPADKKDIYMQLGKDITNTCHESYSRSASKLGPESFYFNDQIAKGTSARQRYYIQRPEVIESYFYLWRLTKDLKYREWGWQAAQAIELHCRVEHGYSGIKDVDALPVKHDDVQQSFLLAETFKYLYLLFSDDDVLPLDQWVFNTEAHPLPVLKGVPTGS